MRRALIFAATLALSSCAFADTLAWDANGINQFGTLDLNNGSFNKIGSLGFNPAGLGEVDQIVYTAAAGGTTLLSVNTHSGATTAVGTSSISLLNLGSTKTGLYTVDAVGGLWSINPTDGASSYIGSTLLPIGNNSIGLSTGTNTLYIALGNTIYTIDTATAQATYLGTSGSTMYGALVGVRNVVYAGSVIDPNAVYSLHPSTGTSTFVAAINAPGYAYGLAPIVPEPGSFALLGIASMLLCGYALKRRRAWTSPLTSPLEVSR